MKRSDVMREVARSNGLIVTNLGFPSRELYALQDNPRNFYMLGSMGLASSIGLGLACSQNKRVYVIDGDGSVLMNMGSLATIARYAPSNYFLIIVDNKVYGSTGNQPTNTAGKTDLLKIAKGAGNVIVRRVKTIAALRRTLHTVSQQGGIIIAETDTKTEEFPIIPLAPVDIKVRFMREVKCRSRQADKR
jgi:sulfopyruvate decarboxylase subunit beta